MTSSQNKSVLRPYPCPHCGDYYIGGYATGSLGPEGAFMKFFDCGCWDVDRVLLTL